MGLEAAHQLAALRDYDATGILFPHPQPLDSPSSAARTGVKGMNQVLAAIPIQNFTSPKRARRDESQGVLAKLRRFVFQHYG
jgi:hypothetical protein